MRTAQIESHRPLISLAHSHFPSLRFWFHELQFMCRKWHMHGCSVSFIQPAGFRSVSIRPSVRGRKQSLIWAVRNHLTACSCVALLCKCEQSCEKKKLFAATDSSADLSNSLLYAAQSNSSHTCVNLTLPRRKRRSYLYTAAYKWSWRCATGLSKGSQTAEPSRSFGWNKGQFTTWSRSQGPGGVNRYRDNSNNTVMGWIYCGL